MLNQIYKVAPVQQKGENVYKILFGKKSDCIGITLDTNEIGLGVLCSKSSAGGWVDIAIFILHIYITW